MSSPASPAAPPATADLDDVLRPVMDVCWQFDYATGTDPLAALYEKSKRLQWNAATDIDWTRPIDPSRPLIDESL